MPILAQHTIANAVALRAAEARPRSLLESSGAGIYGIDLNGRCTFINTAGATLLGYGPDDVLGKDMHTVSHYAHADGASYRREECPIYRAFRIGAGCRVDNEVFWRRHGTPFAVDYSSFPVRDDDGAVVGAVVTFQDITERKEQFRRLQELERLRDNLVHMIVHDLRSPLTAIRGHLDLVRLDAKDKLDAELADSVDEVSKAAIAMTEMVDDLLDVSRLEAGAMPLTKEEVDLRQLALEAISSIGALARHIELPFVAAPEAIPVECDPNTIRRVMVNLIGNALKFTPDRGQVRVSVARDPAGVRVTVTDTGRGIPPEYHTKIFEKFGQVEVASQRVQRSSGLGLTFCKLAVEAHGGRIGVESDVSSGSTFWFVLPQDTPPPALAG